MRNKVMTEIGISESEITEKSLSSNNKLVLLIAGRLVYRKGHALLIDALEKLPSDMEYECRIVGNGPEVQKLKKRCQKSKLLNRVIFVGKIPFEEMQLEYAKANVFLLPSLRETTGTVILEAMGKGLPIITIDKYGGAVILDNNTGWFYSGTSRQEYIDSLALTIMSCIKNPEEVIRKGINARLKAKEYTWGKKCGDYQLIYESLINS